MIENDLTCAWINDLEKRSNINILKKNEDVIGLSLELDTRDCLQQENWVTFIQVKKFLVDAQLAGEGASSRNSGFLVDTTLNDGFTSNKEIANYKKVDIYKLGIDAVKRFIKDYQVDCDWNECGKYFASSETKDKNILKIFQKFSRV